MSDAGAREFLARSAEVYSVRKLATIFGWSKSRVHRFLVAEKKNFGEKTSCVYDFSAQEKSFSVPDYRVSHLPFGTLLGHLTNWFTDICAYSNLSFWDNPEYIFYYIQIHYLLENSKNTLKKQEKSAKVINTVKSMDLFGNTEELNLAPEIPKVGYSQEFEQWYAISLRKDDKASAYKYYLKARKKVNAAILLLAWKNYNEIVQKEARDRTYIKKPYTWLRDEMYVDYVEVAPEYQNKGERAAEGLETRLTTYQIEERKLYPHWYTVDADGYVVRKSDSAIDATR